jgi:osmoprotectant transport system permease protein
VSPLWSALPERLAAHVALSMSALAVGVCVAVPLGVWVARRPRASAIASGFTGVLQTVPSLALLAFMVPALSAIGLRGIGYTPALVALALYSILPVLRNTVTGLRGLDPAVLEAADGVGMTARQRLTLVELPLASPVIVAGVRTAAVWTVGTATLSTPVGASSLGDYIFAGLQTRNHASVLLGCAASALLALALDAAVFLAEKSARDRRPSLRRASLAILLGMALGATSVLARSNITRGPATITIGAKTFTEQYILARVLAGHIEQRAHTRARTLESLGSSVVFDALRTNQIDAYVDYSGTLWTSVLQRGAVPSDRRVLREELTRALRERYGVRVVAALGFENTYALALPRATAASRGVRTISDLARESPSLSIGGDYEIFQRPEWRAIERAYGTRFREQRSMDPSLLYDAARAGQVDAITAFSTDARIDAFDLVLCEDDRAVIPPYDALVLASDRLARERPDVLRALAELEGTIDARAMRRANAQVDQSHAEPSVAAASLLLQRARP